jgi:MSHA biogenesis protein MshP
MSHRRNARSARGFLVIAAVFLLVVLAALIGYLMTVSATSQTASLADVNSARAYQAARAGLEKAAFQVLISGTCTASQDIPFAGNLAGFTARVTCTSSAPITEAGTPVSAYTLTSTACNEPACPNGSTTSPTYVERVLSLTLTK